MSSPGIECSQCGSHEYELLSTKTGEVRCPYCRYMWTVPELIQKTETEKFIEQQAKQPRVVIDNTSETDEKLMDFLSGIFNMGGCLSQVRSIVMGIIALVLIIIIAIVLFNVFL